MKLYQGDVQLFDAKIPKGAKKLDTLVVRSGEGHNIHVLEHAEMYEKEGVFYVNPTSPGAAIVHKSVGGGAGEHARVEIDGSKRVGRGTFEWNPWTNEARRVED